MTWAAPYRGDGRRHDLELPPAPPWRTFPRPNAASVFQPPAGLADAVNAALCLRRPLLVTGAPGSGKSTLVDAVADELRLPTPLRWHITSRTLLTDGLYQYDVLDRIHAQQLRRARAAEAGAPEPAPDADDDIAPFLRLGPLGTALLPAGQPRPLLIDEIDKGDLDLPSDLLDVLERGEFEIPELVRLKRDAVPVREWTGEREHMIERGRVRCREFPFIVLTSNGERDFPAPFLRRCIRYQMPVPSASEVSAMVRAHLSPAATDATAVRDLVTDFVQRMANGESLAIDQLLNAVFLLHGDEVLAEPRRRELVTLLLRDLSGA